MKATSTASAARSSRSIWSPLRTAATRLYPLESARLCAEARLRTGLDDLGAPPVEAPLRVLTESLENEANLRPLGRFLMRIHLRDLLETRLQLEEVWKGKSAALEATRIEQPVFIVGMPRSGSTFLHELLAEHAEYRAPRVWEVMFPVPSGRGEPGDKARRIRKAAACLWWFRRLAPAADAVYPMRAMTPHECVAIHSYTLLSEEFISTCHIPSYEAFLHSTDLTPAYLWERRFLQYLQLDSPGKRWILKSPDHVHGLQQLFSVFPDAQIIQTHRNPVEVVKSSADLTRVLRGLYGPAGEPEEVRAREARMLADGTERFLEFRDSHPELASRFIDIKYTDLIADPVRTVRRICDRLKSPLTESMTRRLQEFASNRARYRGRRASSEPIDPKLAISWEAERFARNCSRFELSFQKAELNR